MRIELAVCDKGKARVKVSCVSITAQQAKNTVNMSEFYFPKNELGQKVIIQQ